jgi:hypothetical protein
MASTQVYANGDRIAVLRAHDGPHYEVFSFYAPYDACLTARSEDDDMRRLRPNEISLEFKADRFEYWQLPDREAAMQIINKLLGTSYA